MTIKMNLIKNSVLFLKHLIFFILVQYKIILDQKRKIYDQYG
jgi:hypothetical protein